MLDRLSGKILHIDFGDCFEVRGDFLSNKLSMDYGFKLFRDWLSLQPLTGRHDQREVPWKDPVQTDEDADQRHGGMQLCGVLCWDKHLKSVCTCACACVSTSKVLASAWKVKNKKIFVRDLSKC